jgi:glycosyltransferase involved in cell wall biosynthesis
MRVLHVIDSLAASGGAEQGLVREVTRFSAGTEQRVVTLYDRMELAGSLRERGIEVEVIGLEQGSGSRSWPRAVTALRRIARDAHPDVIQTSLFLGNLVGQLAGRSLRIPVVSNLVLSGDIESLRSYQPGAATRRAGWLRSIAGWAARSDLVRFRALTEEVKATNAKLLGVDPSSVTVIPRGVPHPSEAPKPTREELGLPEGPLAVNVGRLAHQKGQTLLVEAFAEARKQVPEAHLAIIGREGEASSQVAEKIDQLDLVTAVSLLGHKANVADYLRNAHVFAFPSLMEGLGTAVLEAMALGVPIVAFDIPPVREATLDGRFASLVPVGDVDGLAVALVDRLASGQVVDVEARDWVRQRHDLDRIAGEVEALLSDAAASSAPTDAR